MSVVLPVSGIYVDMHGRKWVLMDQNTWLRVGEGHGPVCVDNEWMRALIAEES